MAFLNNYEFVDTLLSLLQELLCIVFWSIIKMNDVHAPGQICRVKAACYLG